VAVLPFNGIRTGGEEDQRTTDQHGLDASTEYRPCSLCPHLFDNSDHCWLPPPPHLVHELKLLETQKVGSQARNSHMRIDSDVNLLEHVSVVHEYCQFQRRY